MSCGELGKGANFDSLFDGSDAHLLPSSPADCAAKLRQYNRWRRGEDWGPDEDGPNPKELGLLIDFAIDVLEAMSAHDHLMVIAATRYCLGRMTYIVGDCAEWLIEIWPLLNDKTRNIIQRDIEEAFERDDRDREDGREVKALGHDCDRQQWESVRKLWGGEQ